VKKWTAKNATSGMAVVCMLHCNSRQRCTIGSFWATAGLFVIFRRSLLIAMDVGLKLFTAWRRILSRRIHRFIQQLSGRWWRRSSSRSSSHLSSQRWHDASTITARRLLPAGPARSILYDRPDATNDRTDGRALVDWRYMNSDTIDVTSSCTAPSRDAAAAPPAAATTAAAGPRRDGTRSRISMLWHFV